MKLNPVSLCCNVLLMLLLTQYVEAQERFFWLVNIKSDLKFFLHGLVSLNQSGDEQTATLHHIDKSLAGHLEEKDSDGLNLPRPLSTSDINDHDWSNTPMRKATLQNGNYGVENIRKKIGGLESLFLNILTAGVTIPYMTQGQYFNGIEIPPALDPVASLMPSLCTVGGTGATFSPDSSPLGGFLNKTTKKSIELNQCSNFQPDNTLYQFIHLLAETSPKNTQALQIPSMETLGVYNKSQSSLWLLVPNPVMIMLGLIPQNNLSNSLHKDHGSWFGAWFW